LPIAYRTTQDFTAAELSDLYLSVGWSSAKYPERLKQAMANSDSVMSAWDGDRLIGLINCLSDGALTAYFHYLLVRPEYQGQGVGRELLRLMFERYADCLRKVLIADNEQVGFYKKCGFIVGTGTAALFCDADPAMTEDVL
jgi:ribosomal protein S18 acetylase RimI-like enzyme